MRVMVLISFSRRRAACIDHVPSVMLALNLQMLRVKQSKRNNGHTAACSGTNLADCMQVPLPPVQSPPPPLLIPQPCPLFPLSPVLAPALPCTCLADRDKESGVSLELYISLTNIQALYSTIMFICLFNQYYVCFVYNHVSNLANPE